MVRRTVRLVPAVRPSGDELPGDEERSLTQVVEHPAYTPHPPAEGYASPYPPAAAPGRFTAFLLRWYARSPRWLAPAAVLACFGGAAAFVTVNEPVDGAADVTTCLVKLTTGFDCPGCGGTRAFFYLINGNIPAAARHHLVFLFAVPFLAYAFVVWAGNRMFGWRLPQFRPTPLTIGLFMATLGLFSVLRNLPWAPFTWFYV